MVRSTCSMLFVFALLLASQESYSLVIPATPTVTVPATPAVTLPSTPTVTVPATPAVTLPSTPTVTVPATPVPTMPATPSVTLPATPVATKPATPSVPVSLTNTTLASPPPPPAQLPPPPPAPPGFGSDKTAVFSVIKLTGEGLLPFNSSLGQSFVDALGNILGLPSSKVGIRSWTSASRRRLLAADTVSVQSGALFGNGESAAQGLAALTAADASGALQAALRSAGLILSTVSLESSTTALPSNFQPLESSGTGAGGLKLWAIIVIAAVGALVLLAFACCCCSRFLCCCCQERAVDGEEEERLPKMIKFGSMNESKTTPYFANSQRFTPTPQKQGRPLPAMAEV